MGRTVFLRAKTCDILDNNAAKRNTIKNPINWIFDGMIAMAVVIFLLLAAVGYLLFKRSKQKSQTK